MKLTTLNFSKHTGKYVLLVVASCFWGINAQAQTSTNQGADSLSADTSQYLITTFEGGKFQGKILSQDEREYRIQTTTRGTLLIPKYSVASLEKVTAENMVLGQAMWPNPHPSRYFYSPSALPMKKGTGYISISYFALFQAQYALTNHLSIGATTTLLGVPLMFNAKLDKKLGKKLYGSIGGQIGKLTWLESSTLGVGFANLTYGSRESNVTFNVGYGFTNFTANNQYKDLPISTISFNQRFSDILSFVGEFWVLFPNDQPYIVAGGPGFRFYSGGKATWDFGFMGFSFAERQDVYNLNTHSYTTTYKRATYGGLPFISVTYKL